MGVPTIEQIFVSTEWEFLFAGIAMIVSAFSFFYPTYFRRKTSAAKGMVEVIRILESNSSRNARRMLRANYEEKTNLEKNELEKHAIDVKADFLLVQNMIDEKVLSRPVFQRIYSEVMVKTINSYESFLKEFHPSQEMDKQIVKLYKNSYKWYKMNSKVSQSMEQKYEDIMDKIGF